ncbi:hypothetical protein C3729_07600 [Cloacibacterium normanense]|uniref:Uncharacterized protein n=1 Tax=Cloacibacterium normanense TaxID=237258 RepID=A0A2S7I5Q2_9FLAO|nr:KTSC domain-containing protein [Cloacibacterium normanense]PPZ91912.1 hypothetical protein C3729_07600 [Cloacibacterium normanense]
MDLEWQEIGWDSNNIERIAHDGQKLYVEFKAGSGYYYEYVSYEIFVRIMNKEVISKSEGKPSYGATLDALVKKGGYKGIQYK